MRSRDQRSSSAAPEGPGRSSVGGHAAEAAYLIEHAEIKQVVERLATEKALIEQDLMLLSGDDGATALLVATRRRLHDLEDQLLAAFTKIERLSESVGSLADEVAALSGKPRATAAALQT